MSRWAPWALVFWPKIIKSFLILTEIGSVRDRTKLVWGLCGGFTTCDFAVWRFYYLARFDDIPAEIIVSLFFRRSLFFRSVPNQCSCGVMPGSQIIITFVKESYAERARFRVSLESGEIGPAQDRAKLVWSFCGSFTTGAFALCRFYYIATFGELRPEIIN